MNELRNAYADPARAASYARLEFPATYWLAFRDLPALLSRHVAGRRALDFGCGAGRSTRFLRQLGYEVVGADVSEAMIRTARSLDPDGRYALIPEDDLAGFPRGSFDLVLCAYPFDNIPGVERRIELLRRLGALLGPEGRLVLLASTPELYTREWATFTTAAFPENVRAGSGDRVRIVIKEGDDPRPVDDLLWLDDDYRTSFARAGLRLLAEHRPLGREEEPFAWVNETRVAPWAIYVVGPGDAPEGGPASADARRGRAAR